MFRGLDCNIMPVNTFIRELLSVSGIKLFNLIGFRLGVCSSHLRLYQILNFIFDYFSRACPYMRITVYIFSGTCYSCDHDVIGEQFFLTKPIKFDVSGRRILYWSVFFIEPIVDFVCFWVIDLEKMHHATML